MRNILTVSLKVLMVSAIVTAIVFASLSFGNASAAVPVKTADPFLSSSPGGIIINEVMSLNKGIVTSDSGNSDWAELYNTTDKDVNLLHYALTDKAGEPLRWPFPDVVVAAHGYLVVLLTGDIESDPAKGIIHCSFRLSSKGDSLYLTGPSRCAEDYVDIPKLPANVSYGRVGGTWRQIDKPTPGFENSDAGLTAYRLQNAAQ